MSSIETFYNRYLALYMIGSFQSWYFRFYQNEYNQELKDKEHVFDFTNLISSWDSAFLFFVVNEFHLGKWWFGESGFDDDCSSKRAENDKTD